MLNVLISVLAISTGLINSCTACGGKATSSNGTIEQSDRDYRSSAPKYCSWEFNMTRGRALQLQLELAEMTEPRSRSNVLFEDLDGVTFNKNRVEYAKLEGTAKVYHKRYSFYIDSSCSKLECGQDCPWIQIKTDRLQVEYFPSETGLNDNRYRVKSWMIKITYVYRDCPAENTNSSQSRTAPAATTMLPKSSIAVSTSLPSATGVTSAPSASIEAVAAKSVVFSSSIDSRQALPLTSTELSAAVTIEFKDALVYGLIAICVALLTALVIVLTARYCRGNKKRREPDSEREYDDVLPERVTTTSIAYANMSMHTSPGMYCEIAQV